MHTCIITNAKMYPLAVFDLWKSWLSITALCKYFFFLLDRIRYSASPYRMTMKSPAKNPIRRRTFSKFLICPYCHKQIAQRITPAAKITLRNFFGNGSPIARRSVDFPTLKSSKISFAASADTANTNITARNAFRYVNIPIDEKSIAIPINLSE